MNERQAATEARRGFGGLQFVGIAHIVFGALGAIALFTEQKQAGVVCPDENYPWMGPIVEALCLLLFAAGIGLYARARWGRWLSQAWASLALVTVCIPWIDMLNEWRGGDYKEAGRDFAFFTLPFALLAAYPIVSIIVVARAKPQMRSRDVSGK
jgi:hypothetical protein